MMKYACTIDATGISAPNFSEILTGLKTAFRSIYGDDVYLENDGADGQWLAIIAAAINDCNAATIATYNSYSPATAQGAGLSSVVKTNGIARLAPSRSTADLTIIGQAGTTIQAGAARDANGNLWSLPATVVIPPSGETTVTGTCQTAGAVQAIAGAISEISTPTRGWQSVANHAAASVGAPVESDGVLRQRQQVSVALPSRTVFEGTVGAVASLDGVLRYKGYENDTGATDSNGIPRNSICLVVDGGDAMAIAEAISRKKTPGTGTYGTTAETVIDTYGRPVTIRFFRPIETAISVHVTIKAGDGFVTAIGDEIKAAIAAHINALEIGQDVIWNLLYLPANLNGGANSATYKIQSLTVSDGGAPGTADLPIAFNAAARCSASDVSLVVM
ncbi:baseplate J/gp47 family protein [Microvirgula aerodenitrificans]|uniref:baseplate J/gp47 family protein n=1 Tax=Microvirgula aerodenitrificans TaxID=57480 RepID=UPI00248EDFCA|nr:baseplate J/gp47 family protein [Microvirgula aerodenitrificans]